MVRHPRESGSKPRPGQAETAKSKSEEKPERIAKALARAGVASRREVERLIGLGKVAVNGRVLETAAVLVKRDDILTVEGKVVNGPEPARVWRYHKPVGLVTTHKDPQGRPTVFEHLPEGLPRVISVGRLDLNSEGLLLLTNDGGLARALELPATGWRRVYRARAYGRATQADLDRLKDGITLEGVRYGPIEAKLDKAEGKEAGGANLWITVSLSEGKNREVRRVLEALGLKVNRLIRLAYGPFQLGTLESGTAEEVGPRVIRELLGEHIASENMPTGDRTPGPAAKPGRRPGAKAASAPRGTGDPLADPTRKPSRTRVQLEAARSVLANPRERVRDSGAPSRGPGGKAPYKSRDRAEGSFDGAPKRAYGSGQPRTGAGGGGKAPYRPRDGEASDRPARAGGDRKPYAGKPSGSYAGRERPEGGADRPARAGGDRKPYAGKPSGSYAGRERPEGGGDRKPYAGKPAGGGGYKGSGSGSGPSRSRGDDGADKPAARSYAKRDHSQGAGGRPSGPTSGKPGFKPRAGAPGAGRPKGPGAGGPKGPRPKRS